MSAAENVIAVKVIDQLSKMIDEKMSQKKDSSTNVRFKPSRLSRTFLKRITTTDTKKPQIENPTYEIPNPLKKDTTIKSFDIVFDEIFRANGIIIIIIDGQIIFSTSDAGDTADVQAVEIKVDGGIPIKRDDSIKFYFWNGSTTDSIAITPIVRFGD